jgi:3-oxoacyl-[acyl-carrier protein] reductase
MRRVLITGASGAIGRATALELSSRGYHVVLHYRSNKEVVDSLIDTIVSQGGRADALSFDVTDRAEAAKVLSADCEKNGAFYGVVYNVGVHRDAPLVAMSG